MPQPRQRLQSTGQLAKHDKVLPERLKGLYQGIGSGNAGNGRLLHDRDVTHLREA